MKTENIIKEIDQAIASDSRKPKIQAIYIFAGDELEDNSDWMEIASEETEQLNKRLQDIKDYYNEN